MDGRMDVAPAVRSILEAARDRPTVDRTLSVEARPLGAAIERTAQDGQTPILAEIKPTSPTTDGVRRDDPVALAEQMVQGGAAALSVLTEPEHFGGDPEDLRRVRDAVDVPVLRKDFLLREAQFDTVATDAVLIIARFVDDLAGLVAGARRRGFQVMVETHTRAEVEAAIGAGADIVGVNNRDLTSLSVDLGTFERVAPAVPGDATLIAESGITTTDDVQRMREAGADALLVGSALMDGDVRENTERLTEP